MTKLQNLRRNEKFTWNNRTYTVYDQEGLMTEVFNNGRFWAWPNYVIVEKLNYH